MIFMNVLVETIKTKAEFEKERQDMLAQREELMKEQKDTEETKIEAYLKESKIDFLIFTNIGWLDNHPPAAKSFLATDLKEKPLSEVGLAIGNLFTFFRLDFTWRTTHRTENNFKINLTSRLFIR